MKQNYIKILLIIIVITMTIAYASINTTLNINGKVSIESKKGIIFLNALPLVSSEETGNSVINKIDDTVTDFSIILTEQDDSHVSYTIRLFNNSDSYYRLKDIIEDNDNININYSISNLSTNDIIQPQSFHEFKIDFYYKNPTDKSNKILNTFMEYEFEEVNDKSKFADKVVTSEYLLKVLNLFFTRIEELFNQIENNTYEEDIKNLKIEIEVHIREINHILNNTNIYNENLLNGTQYDSLTIDNKIFELDLRNLNSNVPIDIENGLESIKEFVLNNKNLISNNINQVCTLKNDLLNNNINGVNVINIFQEVNDSLTIIQLRDEQENEILSILDRVKELTEKKKDEEVMEQDKLAINMELGALFQEINRIIEETIFNNKSVFSKWIANINNKNIEFSALGKDIFKVLEDNYQIMSPNEFIELITPIQKNIQSEKSINGAYSNLLYFYLLEYEYTPAYNEKKFVDKVSTSGYMLKILNDLYGQINQTYQIIDIQLEYGEDTSYYEKTIEIYLNEIKHILNNTIIYDDNLLDGKQYDSIKINETRFELNLTNININIPEYKDNKEALRQFIIDNMEIITNYMEQVNLLNDELVCNNGINGANLLDSSLEAHEAIMYIQEREGALSEIHSILQRVNELSVQKANGEHGEEDIIAINMELGYLFEEINRIIDETIYEEENVFEKKIININNKDIVIDKITKSEFEELQNNYTTMNPDEFIEVVHNKIDYISNNRATLGIYQNILEAYLI